MKYLGYERTPTDAVLRVEMPDGSLWDVPAQLIADSRDGYYSTERFPVDGGRLEDTIGLIRAGKLRPHELLRWAEESVGWWDVGEHATRVPDGAKPVNYGSGWRKGRKEIIGDV